MAINPGEIYEGEIDGLGAPTIGATIKIRATNDLGYWIGSNKTKIDKNNEVETEGGQFVRMINLDKGYSKRWTSWKN